MLKIFIKERKFKWIMDDKITKKTVIYIIILILLIGGYLTYLILQNTVFNENIKELNYYYEIENEDSISDILNENQTIAFKNDIQKYLEELEYKDKEINNIQIKSQKRKQKLFTCYVLLDDDWQSLYKAKFNIQNKNVNLYGMETAIIKITNQTKRKNVSVYCR